MDEPRFILPASASALPSTYGTDLSPIELCPVETAFQEPAQRFSSTAPKFQKRQLSQGEWRVLKPVIQQMYIDQNKTFEQVSKFILHKYNVSLT